MHTQAKNITPSSSISRNLREGRVWPSQSRYPKTIIAIRLVVAAWLLALGSVLCAYGYWGGALIYLGAIAHLVLAYRLFKTSRAA